MDNSTNNINDKLYMMIGNCNSSNICILQTKSNLDYSVWAHSIYNLKAITISSQVSSCAGNIHYSSMAV